MFLICSKHFLLIQSPKNLIDVVLFIMVLLQLCFSQMCRCWHFDGEKDAPVCSYHNFQYLGRVGLGCK